MKLQAILNGLLLITGVSLLLLVQCGTTDVSGGPTVQTGNGMVAGIVYQPDGKTPARDAIVYLRKKIAATDIPDVVMNRAADTGAVAKTGNDGKFTIDSIDTGSYTVECTDGGNNFALNNSVVLRYFDSTVILPPAILKPAGAIKGIIRLPEGGDPQKVLVIVEGIDRFTTVRADGAFRLERLAESNYAVKVLPTLDNYGVFDTSDIRVLSADTTNLDTIDLSFLGVPTVKNVAVTYDTLLQQVTVRWNRPDSARVKSCNVYRRSVDPVTAVSAQINYIPVTDAIFIDSLCDQNRTYEYRVAAVDANENEGERSAPVQARIAPYDIKPLNVAMTYDTLKQIVTIRWSNPDISHVKSYNVYRRNVSRNEKFWTPFNSKPISDTFFIDSQFSINAQKYSGSDDSTVARAPKYEYSVAALVNDVREGVQSTGIPMQVCLKYLTSKNIQLTYDTLQQMVHLHWNRPDMTLVQGFAVLRRNISRNETVLSQINTNFCDTGYTDATVEQNQTYVYCIASVLKNARAQVKSLEVKMQTKAYFTIDTLYNSPGSEQELFSYPNDIAIATNGDLYIVDQGNSRIQVYDSTMRYKRSIGEGVLDYPLKVSINDQDRIFAANYDFDRDYSSVYIFDATGAVIDTILDSTVINDIDVRNDLLYALTEGRLLSIQTIDGSRIRSWQVNGQYDGKWIAAGDANRILLSTGQVLPERNNVIVFDSLGNKQQPITLPYYPYAIAYDHGRQLTYVLCYNGKKESVLHVIDGNNVEKASCKLQSDDQNISMGLQKSGDVLLVFKSEGMILRLKPLFE